MTRFQVLETAPVLPGCCALCKNDKGPFVDTGMFVRNLGHVYIDLDCVRELSQFVSDPSAMALAQVESIKKAVVSRTDLFEVEVLRGVSEVVTDARKRFSVGVAAIMPLPPEPVVAESEGVPAVKPELQGSESGANSVDGENVSPVSFEGPDNVPSDSNDGPVGGGSQAVSPVFG